VCSKVIPRHQYRYLLPKYFWNLHALSESIFLNPIDKKGNPSLDDDEPKQEYELVMKIIEPRVLKGLKREGRRNQINMRSLKLEEVT
jgi:hypothetical protein